jgi:alpha-1,2-mannosyltransferase
MALSPATPAQGLRAAWSRVGQLVLFGAIPAIVAASFMLGGRHDFAFDFHIFWSASHRVLHGHSPYPSPAAVAAATSPAIHHQFFVYPPLLAVLLLPLAALPFPAAAAINTILVLACVLGALRLLRVADWRCYSVALVSIPVLSSIRLGAISPFLTLATAVAWRYRDRWAIVGSAVGAAVVAKLFVWPLVVWLLLTRRFKAAAAATVGAGAITLAVWAAIGLRGLGDYPSLLRNLTRIESTWGFSLVALADRVGLPDPRTSWVAFGVPLAALLLGASYLRAPRGGLDGRLFVATVGLALLLTPILWLHYLTLLLVPIALRRATFGPEWLLLLCFWISPFQQPGTFAAWRLVVALALVVAITLRVPDPPSSAVTR